MITLPYHTSTMKAKNSISILVIIFLSSFFSSCINKNDNVKYTNTSVIKTDSTPHITISCLQNNIIEITPNNITSKQKIKIIADTICIDSFAIQSSKKSIDIDNMIRNLVLKSSTKNDFTLPYMIAINKNIIPINIKTNNETFTNIKYKYTPIKPKENDLKVELVSGDACPLVYKREQLRNIEIVDIKKWLFLNNIHLHDSLINKIFDITKELCTHREYKYTTLREIPVFKSVKDKKYRIKTNMVADYYYLYVSKDTTEIKEFVAEQVALDFINGSSNINDYLKCNQIKGTGILNFYLIGINKDWSYKHFPFAQIKIDNIGPSIANIDIDKNDKEEAIRQLANQLYGTTNNDDFYKWQKRMKGADLLVGTTDFSGNYPTFIFDFINDVKKVEIEYRGTKRVVDLSKEKSPYYYTCYLPLILGENNISVRAYDSFGNTSRRLIHTITMVRNNN